jgi:hypothetical protein
MADCRILIPDWRVRAARGFTATRNARIDLLFTMSDNTRAPAEAESVRIRLFANE